MRFPVRPPRHPRDPFGWNVVVALVFLGLCLVRLAIPSAPFFDEVHYLPAARAMAELSHPVNTEHPLLGKQIIALGMGIAGDNPWGWRIMSALFGTLALFAGMRAMWFASGTRTASLLTGFFLLTGFPLLVQSRIAMLDIFMVGFVMLALWMCAGAVREAETGRWRLAIAGVALGCAMASKWNAIPVAVVPGLAFLVARFMAGRRRLVLSRRGAPVAGMTLWEAAIWLGAVPLAVYALSFWPTLFYERGAIGPGGFLDLQWRMVELQESVKKAHPYQSNWWLWVSNWRAIWYLYEVADGAQRGVLMMGNPVSSLLLLPALAWCGWAAWARKRFDCLAVAVLYVAALALWVVAPKPVQFFYHYFLPHCFGMAALALACEALWKSGRKALPALAVVATAAMFVWFWPILTAAPLGGEMAFLDWAWLKSWR